MTLFVPARTDVLQPDLGYPTRLLTVKDVKVLMGIRRLICLWKRASETPRFPSTNRWILPVRRAKSEPYFWRYIRDRPKSVIPRSCTTRPKSSPRTCFIFPPEDTMVNSCIPSYGTQSTLRVTPRLYRHLEPRIDVSRPSPYLTPVQTRLIERLSQAFDVDTLTQPSLEHLLACFPITGTMLLYGEHVGKEGGPTTRPHNESDLSISCFNQSEVNRSKNDSISPERLNKRSHSAPRSTRLSFRLPTTDICREARIEVSTIDIESDEASLLRDDDEVLDEEKEENGEVEENRVGVQISSLTGAKFLIDPFALRILSRMEVRKFQIIPSNLTQSSTPFPHYVLGSAENLTARRNVVNINGTVLILIAPKSLSVADTASKNFDLLWLCTFRRTSQLIKNCNNREGIISDESIRPIVELSDTDLIITGSPQALPSSSAMANRITPSLLRSSTPGCTSPQRNCVFDAENSTFTQLRQKLQRVGCFNRDVAFDTVHHVPIPNEPIDIADLFTRPLRSHGQSLAHTPPPLHASKTEGSMSRSTPMPVSVKEPVRPQPQSKRNLSTKEMARPTGPESLRKYIYSSPHIAQ
ncbi:hypothetical protein GMRT_14472 [Giardia muris]|uniref:Uncharacterized protein n=1 Tax=Giardia muris TaxID=5742 RepID=A0A4Z1SRB7_GIAMU|nr:hypothetical protein GMRT_14472 [Giardia muris]|eukprot:TNJ28260.1 hypothetical protein GMRT_14472 [Giardia muris]